MKLIVAFAIFRIFARDGAIWAVLLNNQVFRDVTPCLFSTFRRVIMPHSQGQQSKKIRKIPAQQHSITSQKIWFFDTVLVWQSCFSSGSDISVNTNTSTSGQAHYKQISDYPLFCLMRSWNCDADLICVKSISISQILDTVKLNLSGSARPFG